MQFKYEIVIWKEASEDPEERQDSLLKLLNEYGADGWRLNSLNGEWDALLIFEKQYEN